MGSDIGSASVSKTELIKAMQSLEKIQEILKMIKLLVCSINYQLDVQLLWPKAMELVEID